MKRWARALIMLMFFCSINITNVVFAAQLKRVNCPYCGEHTINILDDEYGACECTSCGGMLLVINGKVQISDGTIFNLKDLYDIEALIQAILDGEFDVEVDDSEYNNFREYLEEDDEGEESYFEENDGSTSYDYYDSNEKLDSTNSSFKASLEDSKTYLYSSDFARSEPESDEEVMKYYEKKNKKKKKATKSNASEKVSTESDADKATKSELDKIDFYIPHVIRYYISIESEINIPQVVYNGEEFTLLDATPIEGFKFLGWSPNKEGKILFESGSPLTLYNFNSNSMPSAKVYDFYAIWEKIDEKNK